MTIERDGTIRTSDVAQGLFDRANPLLITDAHASGVKNVHFNRLSAEEVYGYRKLNARSPKMGGVRLLPTAKRTTCAGMTRWRDGYLFAPATDQLAQTPSGIEAHFRLESGGFEPASGVVGSTRRFTGLSGFYSSVVTGAPRRAGGEHQFFPLVSRGAREIELPAWSLGIGCPYPEGVVDSIGANVGVPQRIVPMFYWWDEATTRLLVAAADFTIFPGSDHHIAVTLNSGAFGQPASRFFVDGAVVATLPMGNGLQNLPTLANFANVDKTMPIYFGRCFTREPGITYSAASSVFGRKNAYMGKWGCVVSGVAGAVITLANQNLAFAGANGSAYVDYRVRVTSGVDTNIIYQVVAVTNRTNDATFALTLNVAPLGIAPGDIVDVIPPVEPMSADVTLQEVRLWAPEALPSSTTISRLAKKQAWSDRNSTHPDENPFLNVRVGAQSTVAQLIAYWPMNEDGGIVCKDHVGISDAYFAPSVLAVNTERAASAGVRSLWLDGETQAFGVNMKDNPNLRDNFIWNLGKLLNADQHWNICVRNQFVVGGGMVAGSAGGIQNHLYETLFSLGNQTTGTPAFEIRLSNYGGGYFLYFALPDGTFVASTTALTQGRWYNAIVGIEAITDGSQTHQVYLQFVDPDNVPGGDVQTFTLGRVTLDPKMSYIAQWGASAFSSGGQGVQGNNFGMFGFACAGVGFHPAHTAASSIALSNTIPVLDFDRVTSQYETSPGISGLDGGLSLTTGSATITSTRGENIPSYLRRWPIAAEHLTLRVEKKGEAAKKIPDNQIVQSVSGANATLAQVYDGATATGIELRAQLWSAFTDFATFDPADDTDLNAGKDAGSSFATTEEVLHNIADDSRWMDVFTAPTYEFTSPFRICPGWSEGIVFRGDIRWAAQKNYKRSDDSTRLLGVCGGSLFEIDARWRLGDGYSDTRYSYALRTPAPLLHLAAADRTEGTILLANAIDALRAEYVLVSNTTLLSVNNGGAATVIAIEADIRVESLGGRRTISSAATLKFASGAYKWEKDHHFYVDGGQLAFEWQSETAAASITSKTNGRAPIRAGEWHRVCVYLDVAASVITAIRFLVDGVPVPATTATVGSPNITGVTVNNTSIGALSDQGTGGVFGTSDPLGGEISGWAIHDQTTAPSPTGYIPEGMSTNYPGVAVVPFQDGSGVAFAVGGTVPPISVYFAGSEAIWLGGGMKDSTGKQVAIEVFNDTAYVVNGLTRPWRYDGVEFTAAGLREPAGRLQSVVAQRLPLRVQDNGADAPPAIGRANVLRINNATSHLRTFAPTAPVPSQNDIGCLVYVPANPLMGAAGDYPGGYIGLISAIAATPGYNVVPTPFAEFDTVAGGDDTSWMKFIKAKVLSPVAASYRAAIALLSPTTPWSARRLICDGKNIPSAPQTEALAEGPTDAGCIHFRGNTIAEIPPFRADGFPAGRDKVIDYKCYIRFDTLEVFGDEEQVIFEQAQDGDSGAFRLSLIEGGRLRFAFFDSLLGKFRSIQTTGRCVAADQWYYLRFRYKWKQAGKHVHDTVGGWEPDLRWLRKAGGTSYQKSSDFRDGLWIYACEGLWQINTLYNSSLGYPGDIPEGAPCLLFTLPGCESPVGATVAAGAVLASNHSQHLLNGGLLKSAPYLTPEEGDSLFPAAGVGASSPRNGIEVVLRLNTIAGLGSGINSVGPTAACQIILPAGFCLPRTCSMNRDDAWNRYADALITASLQDASQIFWRAGAGVGRNVFNDTHVLGGATDVHRTPNLAGYGQVGGSVSYGKQEAWAVLLRIWTMTNMGGGAVGSVGGIPDGASAGVPRVFAIVHLNENDLGGAGATVRGGVSGHRVFITDDPVYGGDGLGSIKFGGVAVASATAAFHATIELMNGSNQAATSGNRLVTPCLLEHGENPVGVNDSPDQSDAPIRFGGTVRQEQGGVVRRGFRGRIDDAGFSILPLASSAANIYTADCMAPDCFFNGPKDTRIQSLPRLNFAYNAASLDDASGTPAARATAVFRFDTIAGDAVVKDASFSSVQLSANECPNGRLIRIGPTIAAEGDHRLRVTFLDPRTGVESNPGEEFVVVVDGKNGNGDFLEAETSFQLTGIPVSGDRRFRVHRRIYKTLPGGGLPLLVTEVKDNATVAYSPPVNNIDLALAKTLSFDNGRPPVCNALKPSETNMFFGGLDDAPSAIAVSKAFKPDQVPGTQVVVGESSRGGPINGLAYLSGVLVPTKRDSLFAVFPAASGFRINRVGQSVGALGHMTLADLDGTIVFLSQKGVYAYAGNQRTTSLSDAIEQLYRRGFNIQAMAVGGAAPYLDRAQVWLLVQRSTDIEKRTILTGDMRFDQFGHEYWVWSILEPGIPVTCIAEFEDHVMHISRIAVGGQHGVFAGDIGDGVGLLSTDPVHIHSGTIAATSVSYRCDLPMLVTPVKDFYSGLPIMVVEEYDKNGNIVALGQGARFGILAATEIVFTSAAFPNVQFFTRDGINFATYIGKTALIGAQYGEWVSRWFDVDQNETTKAFDFIDLVFNPIAGGAVFVTLFMNGNDSQAVKYFRVPLDTGRFSVPITSQYAYQLKFRINWYGLRIGFVMHKYSLRSRAEEWGKRQRK